MSVDDVVGPCRVVPQGYPTGERPPQLVLPTGLSGPLPHAAACLTPANRLGLSRRLGYTGQPFVSRRGARRQGSLPLSRPRCTSCRHQHL